MMTGDDVAALMRQYKVTIKILATRLDISQTRVRLRREEGISEPNVERDWRQAITGEDPEADLDDPSHHPDAVAIKSAPAPAAPAADALPEATAAERSADAMPAPITGPPEPSGPPVLPEGHLYTTAHRRYDLDTTEEIRVIGILHTGYLIREVKPEPGSTFVKAQLEIYEKAHHRDLEPKDLQYLLDKGYCAPYTEEER